MAKKRPEQFIGLSMPDQYPPLDVADHEVLLSFYGDSDALAFREWWAPDGATAFQAWLVKRKKAVDPK